MNKQNLKQIIFIAGLLISINGTDLYARASIMPRFVGRMLFGQTETEADAKAETQKVSTTSTTASKLKGEKDEETLVISKEKLANIARRLSAAETELKELRKKRSSWLSTKPITAGITGLGLGAALLFFGQRMAGGTNPLASLMPILRNIPLLGKFLP